MVRSKSRGKKMVSAEMLCLLAEQMLNSGRVRREGERKDEGLMWEDVTRRKGKTGGDRSLYGKLTSAIYILGYTFLLYW